MGNILIGIGFSIVIVGILFNVFRRFGIPPLPGDIVIQRDNVTFFFPIATSILVSIILTIIINLMRK